MANLANSSQGAATQDWVATGALLRSDGLMFGKLFDRYNERDFLYFLESNRNWAVADDTIINWHEDGWIINNVQIESFTGGATVGATAVVTIPDAQHQDSGTRSPFTIGQICKIDDVFMIVTAKSTAVANAHTITVKQISTATTTDVALDTKLAAGKVIIPLGNAYAEQTSYEEGEQRLPEKFTENIGITKNKSTVSGTQATNKFKIDLGNGEYYWMNKMDKDLFLRHKLDINFGLLLGPGGTTTNAAGDTVYLMKGFEQQIRERGNVRQYSSTLTINDVNNWTRTLVRENAPKEALLTEGHEACILLDDLMTSEMKQGGRVYLEGKAGDLSYNGMKMIDFTNDGFYKSGFMFYRKKMPEFNHRQVTYGNNQPYSNYIMVTPMAMTKDPITHERGFTMRIGYKAAKGVHGVTFDRKFQLKIGGDGYDSEVDEVNLRYLTECGGALVNAHQAIISEKA